MSLVTQVAKNVKIQGQTVQNAHLIFIFMRTYFNVSVNVLLVTSMTKQLQLTITYVKNVRMDARPVTGQDWRNVKHVIM